MLQYQNSQLFENPKFHRSGKEKPNFEQMSKLLLEISKNSLKRRLIYKKIVCIEKQ